MSISVTLADSEAERDALYRFRYQIYVEELGLKPPEADTKRKVLTDPLDAAGLNYVLRENDEVAGCLRVHYLSDLSDISDSVEKYQMQPALDTFGISAICTTSRFMLHPRLRHGRSLLRLMETAMRDAQKKGIRVNYGDCSPHLVPLYEHLGYRRYTRAYNDTAYGFKVPILMLVADRARFSMVGSPLARLAATCPDDSQGRKWFEESYPDYVSLISAPFLPEGVFFDLLANRVSNDPAHSLVLLKDLSRSEIEIFLKEASTVHTQPMDKIVRQGERGDTLFVILNGICEVFVQENPELPVAICGAGDHFGEIGFLTGEPRTATVIAKSQCEILVLSGDFLQRFIAKEPEIAAKVLLNLSRVLASRLAFTTKTLAQTISAS